MRPDQAARIILHENGELTAKLDKIRELVTDAESVGSRMVYVSDLYAALDLEVKQ